MLATGSSLDDFYEALVKLAQASPDQWSRVEVFQMDEYVGLNAKHPESFHHYLKARFLNHVDVAEFVPIRGSALRINAELVRYAELLARPIDIVTCVIRRDGGIGFNRPGVANFRDRARVRLVELHSVCRQEQVDAGLFSKSADVPDRALSITMPVLASAGMLCGIAAGPSKARAVCDVCFSPVRPECPAMILRYHPNAFVFTDRAAASLLPAD